MSFLSLKEFNEKPLGQLLEVIGAVNNIYSYFTYDLKSRNLWFAQKTFTMEEHQRTNLEECCSKTIVEDRTESHHVFTIDPENCRDFDDAISISDNVISVYISNVPLILECLEYYDKLTEQVATVYLPNQIRHMLPKSLSEGFCSLVADGTKKAVFYMDIFSDETIKFGSCWVKVDKNFVYEEKSLLTYPSFKEIKEYAKKKSASPILDSHDVVQFFMLFMNHECSVTLLDGIYRSTSDNTTVARLYDYFGEYSLEKSFHKALQLDSYGHFTSPIRRIVDIVNLILLQQQLHLCCFRSETMQFCERWKEKVDDLNKNTRAIRTVEQNALWLHEMETLKGLGIQCISDQYVEVLKKEPLSFNIWKYTVLLRKRNRIMTFKSHINHYAVGESLRGYLYYFQNEDNLKKKVQLQITN